MLSPVQALILVVSLVLWMQACSAKPSTWRISRAEEFYAEGRLNNAIRYTDQVIQRNYATPSDREILLHIRILRDLERDTEADAFSEFTKRFADDAYSYEDPTVPSRKECKKWRVEDGLVSQWGNFGHLKGSGSYELGTLATIYEINYEGRVGNIKVLRAKHPAAAWQAIESIANAKISRSRLETLQRDSPDAFPVSMCAWWTYDEIRDVLPPYGQIRGAR